MHHISRRVISLRLGRKKKETYLKLIFFFFVYHVKSTTFALSEFRYGYRVFVVISFYSCWHRHYGSTKRSAVLFHPHPLLPPPLDVLTPFSCAKFDKRRTYVSFHCGWRARFVFQLGFAGRLDLLVTWVS